VDGDIKLNLGSGGDVRPGYVNADIRRETGPDVVCDMHSLPFRDDVFNEVLLIDVIEHSKEPVRVLRELHRVLKKDAELWLRCPDFEKIIDPEFIESTPFENTENKLLGGRDNPYDQHKSLYTADVLRKRLEEAGFNGVVVKKSRDPPVHWHLLAKAVKNRNL